MKCLSIELKTNWNLCLVFLSRVENPCARCNSSVCRCADNRKSESNYSSVFELLQCILQMFWLLQQFHWWQHCVFQIDIGNCIFYSFRNNLAVTNFCLRLEYSSIQKYSSNSPIKTEEKMSTYSWFLPQGAEPTKQ